MIQTRTVDSYHFGFSLNLIDPQLRTLTAFFHHPAAARQVPVLGGRTSVTPAQLDGIGSVVIKHYRRGGLLRYFIKDRYLRSGITRAQREFEMLGLAGNLGIHVPQPVAYAYRGRLFYLAWLVTRAIREPVSLARLSLQDKEKTRVAVQSSAEQIALLIQNNILHIDLHPGNVVVDIAGNVYLLDFDKGRFYHGSRDKLKDRYIARWQRAVVKHRLPEMLSDALRTGLKNIRI
jgi:tRNA A-37 threonylcarbamoyl transferase component Bud32